MVLCIIAFCVFAVMSIFSAKYRPLAREGLRCVFRTLMMKPCDTGLDEQIKATVVSGVLSRSPTAARFINKHFTALSWIFVILTVASFAYTAYGVYNFYFYGNCEGQASTGACILNDLTGDYGRFSEPKDLIAPTKFDGIAMGNSQANVTVVEFGCFTCPYTKKAEPEMLRLLKQHEQDGAVYYVFKPFPLPNHKYSYDAAKAVLCARNQNKQWELQDLIFKQQEVCSVDGILAIKGLAEESGLNMTEFNRCYDNNETTRELDEYVQQGKDAHIYATPTFFINGKAMVGPKTTEQLECAVNQKKGILEELKCIIAGAG